MPSLIEYKCPCCGGGIAFDSSSQMMKCPYCDTEFDVETLKQYDEALKNDQADAMQWETPEQNAERNDGMCVYICQSCGGEVIGSVTTAAMTCPYCDNPVIMKGSLAGEFMPDLVIPFKLDKEAAKEAYRNHLKGKKLLPKVFADENHIDELKGVYVPFWLFNANTEASIRYRATKTRVWMDRDYEYTETSYYSLVRDGSLMFENVPVDGSSQMPDDLMESLEPFDLTEAVDFQTAYLSGYLADKYDVDEQSSVDRANNRIKKTTEQMFASTIGNYVTSSVESSSIRSDNGTAKYAFFPVWLLNTTWNDKKYVFAMNGQTGKLVGDLPMDKKKFWLYFAMYAGIFSAALFLLLFLLFGIGGSL